MSMFWSRIAPSRVVKAQQAEEEDIVDPQQVLREKCGAQPKCAAIKEKLDSCNARVLSRSQTAESCAEELYDWMHCVDHCVAKDLFKQLK